MLACRGNSAIAPSIHSYVQQCMLSHPQEDIPSPTGSTARPNPTRNRAPNFPAHSLLTTLTELSRLVYNTRWTENSWSTLTGAVINQRAGQNSVVSKLCGKLHTGKSLGHGKKPDEGRHKCVGVCATACC
jgi:hypothetical protein